MSRWSLILIICICSGSVIAQSAQETDSTQTELDSLSSRSSRFIVLPIISYSPETSLRLGAVGAYFFRGKNAQPGTQLSSIRLPLNYTLNQQIKIRMSYDIFLNDNRHIFKGVAEWIRFPLLFWGIGNDTPDDNEEIYTTRTMTFDISYLAKVSREFFLGGRFIQQSSKITEVEEDGLLIQEGLIPGNEGAQTSGLGIVARIDKRDNNYNAAIGPFIQADLITYQSWLGSEYEFTKLRFDLRHFIQTFGNRHVLAFNLVTEHNWGDPTFETMALLGGDQIMRGHYLGRFRDKTMIASQIEYRFPLGRRNWIDEREKIPFWERWGMVGFLGAGNVAPSLSELGFEDLKSSWGFGLRYAAMPKERLNIRIDFGFGTQTPGFYLNIRESF